MTPLTASTPLFAIVSALVEERAGLHYGPAAQDLLLERVGARAGLLGFESLLDYYYYLRYDAGGSGELEHLLEALVVNETFFFRELNPLRVLVDRLVAPRVASGRTPRIWSAACATGEEPLTLAMLLAEANLLESVELIASDLSQHALNKARSGRFARRSLREVPDLALAQRWIHEDGPALTVAPKLRDAISWRRLNLCDSDQVAAVGPCDAILCRNVLIYFSDSTAMRVVEGLSRALKPEGALLVGVAESLLRFGSTLACEELDQVFMYRRAA